MRALPLLIALPLSIGACAFSSGLRTAAGVPDWPRLADVETVVVVTRDPDGDERATKVWLVVVDGVGIVRTGATRWFANLEREPSLRLRARSTEYRLRVDRVMDPEEGARIDAAFRAKYGWQDRLVSLFRASTANTNWMKLRRLPGS